MIDPNSVMAAQGLVSGNPGYNILNGLPPYMPADAYGNPDWDALSLMQAHRLDSYFQPAQRFQFGTDTVRATLTPGEAVLNKNAAEILGRDKIKALNAKGNKVQSFQGGTAYVNDPNDPLGAAQGVQKRKLPGTASFLPAANLPSSSRNTTFATGAPVNTIAQNSSNQVPVGGYGLGALNQAGYSRSPQMNVSNFLNPSSSNQQPTITGYHWTKGTGGVSGGNNDVMRQYYSDGTMRRFTGGVEDKQPLAATQYTLPGVNADVRALSDPSVNALAGAQRSTNQYGQQVVNPVGGGQIISGKGPSFGSLQGSTPAADAYNRPGLNTPSGGQAFAGPSLRKPMDKLTPGQTWSLGGWY